MNSIAAEVFADFISLFFPRYCAGCHEALIRQEHLICTACILHLPRSNYHLNSTNHFYDKLKGRFAVKYVLSFFKFSKRGRVQNILHELKYRNKPELGRLLGKIYGFELFNAGFHDSFDIIVPIPLHPRKKKMRGYNQSEEFGKGLSESLKIPCSDKILCRSVMTGTQTKRSRLQRWQNVKDIFVVNSPEKISYKRILLIDDVVTTGATLEAAANSLLNNHCAELSIACIAATE